MNCKEKLATYIEIPEIFIVILQDKYIVFRECYFKHYVKVWKVCIYVQVLVL